MAVGTAFLAFGLLTTLGGGDAGAAPSPAVTGSGVTTCNVSGTLRFSPALEGESSGSSTATVSATLSSCISSAGGKLKVASGHLEGLIGSVSPANCTSVAIAHVAPPLSAGSVAWAARTRLTASKGVSFPVGGATIVTIGGVTFLQVSYSGGDVTDGSYANSGDTSMTVTSDQNDAQLAAKCSSRKGLTLVNFKGTSTL